MNPFRVFSKRKLAMLASACMITAGSIIASDGVGDDLDLSALLNITLETGSFLELDLESSPVSITIIDKQKVYESGARTLNDLVEIYTPSFQYMHNRWNGEIWSMRGVSADFNNKIIFLVNGIKMNLQARNGAFTEMNLGLFGDIERVEVLEGPAGMVYGSGAIAGVINIVTKNANTADANNGDIWLSANHHSWGVEGNSHNKISDDASITLSGGYRFDEGAGEGATRLYGYQDWPENANKSTWGPSKGSVGKTPGNIRIGLDAKWKNFSLYARGTRQQHSTASMFGRFPWDNHQRAYVDPTGVTVTLDPTSNEYTTDIDGSVGIGSFATEALALAHAQSLATAHNAKYFPDVEIDGTTYKYADFLANPDAFMSTYAQANQTRRFITDNVAAELKWEQPVGENKITTKIGFAANQCLSMFENNGFAEEIPAWSIGYTTSPDYIWSAFGEKRFSGQFLFDLKQVSNLQSVTGMEFRLDKIGDDFQGRNMQFGSESKHVVTPVDYKNFAIFSENYYTFNDNLSALAGIRFDKHTRTDGVVSPKIALIAKANENHIFKLFGQMSSNNGSAYAYEFNENHYDFAGETGVTQLSNGKKYVDNPNATVVVVPTKEELNSLNPEISRSVEFISTHKLFDNKLTISPSVSLNQMLDNFVWNSAVQRNMNMGDYNAAVGNLTVEFNNDVFQLGVHNTLQRPVKTDKDQISVLSTPTIVQVGAQEVIDNDLDPTKTWYKLDPLNTTTQNYKLVKEAVTFNGTDFLNIATFTTKVYGRVQPVDWFSANFNTRIFWGIKGREEVNKTVFTEDATTMAAEANADYLDSESSAIVKLNAGLHFHLPEDFKLSVYGTNLLGKNDNVHAVRWQQMVSNKLQRKVYTLDQANWEVRVTKEF